MTALLRKIEKHLNDTGMKASRFGREAAGDSRLVFDLRNGRAPRERTRHKVEAFFAAQYQPSPPEGRWSEQQCWLLLAIIAGGGSKADAAERLGRTPLAVHARLYLLIDQHLPERPRLQRAAASARQILASVGAISLKTLDRTSQLETDGNLLDFNRRAA